MVEQGKAEQDLRKMEVDCGKWAEGFGRQYTDGQDTDGQKVAEVGVSELDVAGKDANELNG